MAGNLAVAALEEGQADIGIGNVGAYWLAGFVDARTPLLVADAQGIRIRLGRTWRGLPWQDIEQLEHEPRRGLLRDGRLVLVPRETDAAVLTVPLSLSTRVVGADDGSRLERAVIRGADAERIGRDGIALLPVDELLDRR